MLTNDTKFVLILAIMELKDLKKSDMVELAKKIGRNPIHLRKIAIGERPCTARLAAKIEQATGGMIKKEDLVSWG